MAHVPQRIIRAANRRAQRRLRAVLVEQTYNEPGHRTTTLYHQSERLLDSLKGERDALPPATFDPAEGSWDPMPALADPGDHHVYVSAAR